MDTWTISSEKYHEQLSQTAYSIGFILGDGCFHSASELHENGKWYSRRSIQIAKQDLEPIERVRDEIASTFGIKYSVFERKPEKGLLIYHLRAARRDVFDFFSVNTSFKAIIPQFYFSADDDVKRDLIAGLMDSDGYIAYSLVKAKYPQWQLGFAMTKREIVAGAANIMRSLGVKVGKIGEYEKGRYRNMHAIYPNIRSFIDAGFYFHSSRKNAKIQSYLDHVLGSETLHAASTL
jgi:intein/homing endonuclease